MQVDVPARRGRSNPPGGDHVAVVGSRPIRHKGGREIPASPRPCHAERPVRN